MSLTANIIIGAAERTLQLRKRKDYNDSDSYAVLERIIMDVQTDCPGMIYSHPITTTVSVGSYTLPANAFFVHAIVWPEDWPMKQLTPEAFLALVDSDPEEIYPTQYALIRQNDGYKLSVYPASKVAAGEAITVKYSPAGYELKKGSEDIAAPDHQLHLLELGVTYKLAEIYVPQRAEEFERKYMQEKIRIRGKQTHPTTETLTMEYRPF